MPRCIRIESCKACPHFDHRGAFGAVAYVPYCRIKRDNDLPYNMSMVQGKPYASGTGEIPEWCPLPKLGDV